MVNHPNRGNTPTAVVRRMLGSFSLQRIEIIATRDGFTARALPDGFHPLVAKRRDAVFATKSEWTLAEASKVQEEAMRPVAQVRSDSLDEALLSLRETLADIG